MNSLTQFTAVIDSNEHNGVTHDEIIGNLRINTQELAIHRFQRKLFVRKQL
jgi:hypothetical protein